MNTKFTYALILTIAQAVFSLLLYFGGYQTEKMAAGQYLNWLGLPIAVTVLWLGIKAVREETPDKSLTYGQGVGAGVLISLYSGLMSGAYNFVHFKYIVPEFFDYQFEMMRTKWAAAGINETQIEQMGTMTRKFMGPVSTAIMTPVMSVIFGLIVALIVAAFLKRPAPVAVPPAVS